MIKLKSGFSLALSLNVEEINESSVKLLNNCNLLLDFKIALFTITGTSPRRLFLTESRLSNSAFASKCGIWMISTDAEEVFVT